MNIDEFIEHTKEKAREHRYHADFFESDNPMNTVCIKSAEDCEQLAGWLKKAEEYQQLEERLNKVYGDCDGLLLRVVEKLEKHPRIYMANNTLKSRLLTDEDVDKWEEYKLSDEQGRLIKLPCKVGDTVYADSTMLPIEDMECYEDIENKIPSYFPGRVVSFRFAKRNWMKIAVKAKWLHEWIDDETGPDSNYIECEKNFAIPLSGIGKTVFLTQSEAEAKLKELRGGENESSNS